VAEQGGSILIGLVPPCRGRDFLPNSSSNRSSCPLFDK
jgi:hypothetical protein